MTFPFSKVVVRVVSIPLIRPLIDFVIYHLNLMLLTLLPPHEALRPPRITTTSLRRIIRVSFAYIIGWIMDASDRI